jgi:hypothetical protein
VFNFLYRNNIANMDDLEREVRSMYGQTDAVLVELKKIERRKDTLDKHIEQAGYFTEFRKVYQQYKQQKPNRKEAFYEAHRREITLYEAAERYLTPVLNGHPLNLAKWKAERRDKAAEKDQLYQQYYALKAKTKNVETIRRTVMDVLREGAIERMPQRERGITL